MTPEEARGVLGLGPQASAAEIEQAFRLKSRMSHPDRHHDATESERAYWNQEFVRAGEARQALLEAARRPRASSAPPRQDEQGSDGRTAQQRPSYRDPAYDSGPGPARPSAGRLAAFLIAQRLLSAAPGLLGGLARAAGILLLVLVGLVVLLVVFVSCAVSSAVSGAVNGAAPEPVAVVAARSGTIA